MDTGTTLIAIMALAFLAESLTEYFFSPILETLKIDTKYLRYVASIVGVALALLYQVDLLQTFLGMDPKVPILSQVFSGIILGRGATYVHDLYSQWINKGR